MQRRLSDPRCDLEFLRCAARGVHRDLPAAGGKFRSTTCSTAGGKFHGGCSCGTAASANGGRRETRETLEEAAKRELQAEYAVTVQELHRSLWKSDPRGDTPGARPAPDRGRAGGEARAVRAVMLFSNRRWYIRFVSTKDAAVLARAHWPALPYSGVLRP